MATRTATAPPAPEGAGYTLEDDGRLLVEPGVTLPPATDWIPLWRWGDGAVWCTPAFPVTAGRPCRWVLDCDSPGAVVTIPHGTYGNIDACAKHAEDYRLGSSPLSAVNGMEADPECWCPDNDKKPGTRINVDYCPCHGRGRTRALSRDPSWADHVQR